MPKPKTDEKKLKSVPFGNLQDDVLYEAMEEMTHSDNPNLVKKADSLMKTYALFCNKDYFADLKKGSENEQKEKMSQFFKNCRSLAEIPDLFRMAFDYHHTGWQQLMEKKPELAEKLDKRVNELGTYIEEPLDKALKRAKISKSPEVTDKESVKRTIAFRKNEVHCSIKALVALYGPKGTFTPDSKGNERFLPEFKEKYQSIELPVPEDLTPEIVALIAAGDAMEPKYMEKAYTSSSNITTLSKADWNADFLANDIIMGDSRVPGFSEPLTEARQHTKQILEEYMNGHPENVQKALNNFLSRKLKSFQTFSLKSRLDHPDKEYPLLLEELSKNPKLGVKIPEGVQLKLKSHNNRIKAAYKGIDLIEKICTEKPAPNSKEREDMLAECLFQFAVSVEGITSLKTETSRTAKKEILKTLDHYAKFSKAKDGADLLNKLESKQADDPELSQQIQRITTDGTSFFQSKMEQNIFTPGEMLLTSEDGEQKLRDLYLDDIKKTELFQNLLKEPNMTIFSKKLVELYSNSDMTFRSYSDKKVPVDDPTKLNTEKGISLAQKELTENLETYHKKVMEKEIAQSLKALNANSFFHIDSKELKELKKQTMALQKAVKEAALPVTDNPEVKKAMLAAYKASAAYETAKRKDANAEDDREWTPKTDSGKERMAGAKIIEDLAKRYIMDDVVKVLQHEEDLKRKQLKEKSSGTLLDRGSEAKELMQSAIAETVGKAAELGNTASAKDMGNELAKVLAVNVVGRTYQLAGGVPDVEPDGEPFDLEKEILKAAEDIKSRTDFQQMLDQMNVKEAVSLTVDRPDGKLLADKLVQVRKDLLKKELVEDAVSAISEKGNELGNDASAKEMSEQLAAFLAVGIVTRKNEVAGDVRDAHEMKKDIKAAAKEIQGRPDFQRTIQGMKVGEAISLTVNHPDGKLLVDRLAQVKKQMAAEKEPERNFNPPREMQEKKQMNK